MKVNELREISDEQLELTAKEAAESLFRLRIQSQTDKLDAPSELRRNRRLIAQVKTIQTQRAMEAEAKEAVAKSLEKSPENSQEKTEAVS
jgi:large subunit ribosomal protein L29